MKMSSLVKNMMLTRTAWLRKLLDPRRDIDAECGHPSTLEISDYQELFTRGDIAARVVTIYPQETWSEDPLVFETEDKTETEFEKAWNGLLKTIPIYSLLQRADILSGIGRFGVLLLGVDDGKPMNEPLDGIDDQGNPSGSPSERKLLYLRTFEESVLSIAKLEDNTSNPRYGQPYTYNINFADKNGSSTLSQSVHWSRIIHIADNRTNSEVYGAPRMEVVVNRLLDLKKTAGGSGEMFWKGGFPGLSIETQPSEEEVTLDKEATQEQIEKYMNGLQRYIATIGLTAKSLSVQVADPGPHVDMQLKLIGAALGVPWRIFVGSEVGQLASGMDTRRWNQRITRRRNDYVTPYIIRPFVDRLAAAGILPQPKNGYQVEWTDPNTPSEDEKAAVAQKRTDALMKYVQSGADQLMPPFHYLTLILGFTDDEAQSILDDAMAQGEADRLLADPAPQPAPTPTATPDRSNRNKGNTGK